MFDGDATATALVLAVTACAAAGQAPTGGFDSTRAYGHLRDQVDIGPRVSGTPANVKTRQYIISTLGAARHQGGRAAVRGAHAGGHGGDGEHHCHAAGRRAPSASSWRATSTPSSFASSASSAPAMAGRARPPCSSLAACSRTVRAPSRSSCCSSTAKRRSSSGVPTDSTYGSRHYVQAARAAKHALGIKALILLDMIGDRDLNIRREANSTPWLTDIIWTTARRLGHQRHFLDEADADRRRPPALLAGRRSGRGHHRSRLRSLAHGRGHARERQRAEPADCRGRRARGVAGDRQRLLKN